MKTAIVKFENGDTITTNINGTDEEIRRYYMGHYFDMGIYPEELMVKALLVEILQEANQ